MPDYSVVLTPTAETIYRKLHDDAQSCIDAGDTSNAKLTLMRMVDDAIDNIIPHDPFNVGNAQAHVADSAASRNGPLSRGLCESGCGAS
jgi:hypothetical protein